MRGSKLCGGCARRSNLNLENDDRAGLQHVLRTDYQPDQKPGWAFASRTRATNEQQASATSIFKMP